MLYMEGEQKQIKISSSMLGPTNKQPKQSRHRRRNPKANVALEERISNNKPESEPPDDFDSSIDYLRSLTPSIVVKDNNIDDSNKLVTDTKPKDNSSIIISTEPFPSTNNETPIKMDNNQLSDMVEVEPIISDAPMTNTCQPNTPVINVSIPPIKNDPPYGVLRNGVKQTYRSWKRARSGNQSNSVKVSNSKPVATIGSRNKTLRRYPIGINGKRISLLMKNISIKQNVEKEIESIKKHSMTIVKRTLKRNNIIKDGTTAPVEMLRNLYENCTLAGKIVNKSPKILIHNFVNDNKN